MTGPQIDAIGVAVSDMAVAIAFYSRLGLDFETGSETQPHAEAALGSSMRLMLDTEAMLRQIDPEWVATPGGRLGLAVRLPDASALDALYAELDVEGLGVKQPWNAFWGQRYAVIRDPDGLHLDLYAQLPDDSAGSTP
ncbi:MAG: VOC family protein [Geodermatophilaceae bacterium]